ncbi:MAG: hypothetical protein WDO73_15720 [Ignavibacteriota bacterium]
MAGSANGHEIWGALLINRRDLEGRAPGIAGGGENRTQFRQGAVRTGRSYYIREGKPAPRRSICAWPFAGGSQEAGEFLKQIAK